MKAVIPFRLPYKILGSLKTKCDGISEQIVQKQRESQVVPVIYPNEHQTPQNPIKELCVFSEQDQKDNSLEDAIEVDLEIRFQKFEQSSLILNKLQFLLSEHAQSIVENKDIFLEILKNLDEHNLEVVWAFPSQEYIREPPITRRI